MNEHCKYSKQQLLRLARRVNNPKRSYLLVNPLQGKHMPVRPEAAIAMMQTLGRTVKGKHPGRPLVIGFSETATAIGAVVAAEIGEQSLYLQTTREKDDAVRQWVFFSEEHSHATEQKLCGDNLEQRIRESDYILLIDDEISTGKTILNTVVAIRNQCSAARRKPFVVASIINRVDMCRLSEFDRENVSFVYLLHPEAEDYEEKVKDLTVWEAKAPQSSSKEKMQAYIERMSAALPSPRRGVTAGEYLRACQKNAEEILGKLHLQENERILVLGTEEFMFPALLLAKSIENTGVAAEVSFHATTRSPIGICGEAGYPITNGMRIHSFYSKDRITYLYDLESYDTVIVFTDAADNITEAFEELCAGLKAACCAKALLFCGGQNV